MTERWRAIPRYEGLYEVSDQGYVRSLDHRGRRQFHRGRILKSRPSGQGDYPAVGLHRDGVKVDRYIHQLVLLAFVGPRPEGMHSRHLNGDQTDNRLVNLAYGTPAENAADKHLHGTARTRLVVATHCQREHLFSDENTFWDRAGLRHCRACMRANDRRSSRRRRTEGLPVDDARHGTVSGYINFGCKCAACSAVGREYRRHQRRKAA